MLFSSNTFWNLKFSKIEITGTYKFDNDLKLKLQQSCVLLYFSEYVTSSEQNYMWYKWYRYWKWLNDFVFQICIAQLNTTVLIKNSLFSKDRKHHHNGIISMKWNWFNQRINFETQFLLNHKFKFIIVVMFSACEKRMFLSFTSIELSHTIS